MSVSYQSNTPFDITRLNLHLPALSSQLRDSLSVPAEVGVGQVSQGLASGHLGWGKPALKLFAEKKQTKPAMTASPGSSCARGPATQTPREPSVPRAAGRVVAVTLLLGPCCSARWAPAPRGAPLPPWPPGANCSFTTTKAHLSTGVPDQKN